VTILPPASPAITASNRGQYNWPNDFLTVPKKGIRVRIFHNGLYYPDSVTPVSNAPNTPDVVYKFRIPPSTPVQAMEAYVLAQDGTVTNTDTFLAVMPTSCEDYTYSTHPVTAADIFSSDDSNPPGGISSHVHMAQLSPGEYLLVPTFYSLSNAGPVWFEVVFTDATERACLPVCVGKLCGPNGCGGSCNVQSCQSPEYCNEITGRCSICPMPLPSNFVPNCQVVNFTNGCFLNGLQDPYAPVNQTYTRNCGVDSDFCGGTCGPLAGACPDGQSCQLEVGLCVTLPKCDLYVPQCFTPAPVVSGKKYFCTSNCTWAELNDPLPDIATDIQADILNSMLFHWRNFDTSSCTISEGCIPFPGKHLLLRFDTNTHNIGTKAYVAPSPYARPDVLTYAKCHQHFHENGFAYFYLSFDNGTAIRSSQKKSYCVATAGFSQVGPKTTCASLTTCCEQGLESGSFDSYGSDLDCQWLTLTDFHERKILGRWYQYTVGINQHRLIVDYSFFNDQISFPVFLPYAPKDAEVIIYSEYIKANPDICCSRPGGPHPVYCPQPTYFGVPYCFHSSSGTSIKLVSEFILLLNIILILQVLSF